MSISKPYDLAIYPQAKAAVAVYGNKGMAPSNAFGPNIPAGVEVIFGGHAAQGELPVDINVVVNSVITDKVLYPLGTGINYEAVSNEPLTPEKPLPPTPVKTKPPIAGTTNQIPNTYKKLVKNKNSSIIAKQPHTGDSGMHPLYFICSALISGVVLSYVGWKKRKAKNTASK